MIPDHYQFERRYPTTAELGLDVTVGIVANTSTDGCIVAVSDQQISYNDIYPSQEQGLRKIVQIGPDKSWFCAFSANDVAVVPPLLAKVIEDLKLISPQERTFEAVKDCVADAYSDVRHKQFVDSHLRAIGYETVEQFRKEGFADLGRDEHQKHFDALYKFDLGVDLLVFGHAEKRQQRIFTVHNPGKCTHWNWRGFTAVGSGTYLALGSLHQRPISFDLEDVIYRLLEAKFVAEGGYVGRTTTVLTLSPEGESWEMRESEIEQIRQVWKRKREEPTPDAAVAVIRKTSALRHLYKDGEP